ncbi:MAG: PilZ domain-containing protein [Porticoccaceae bacterium]|jgi:type IV pilus assembly protein PilZ|nr:PilZ domain-containing protein [Porticoccaceae bacterium]
MKGLGGLRSAILNVSIKDIGELYQCYMPFVTNGGLFIATNRQFLLEDEVFVVLELLDEPEKFPLTGKVVWITPAGVVTNRKQGIGIQFSPGNAELVSKIETQLAGMLNSDRATYTL